MTLKAIMDQLKTGSVKDIYTRGNIETYPAGKGKVDLLNPYVLVHDDFSVNSYYATSMSIHPIVIDAHFPPGYINELNKYIEEEVPLLLHRKRLNYNVTEEETVYFQVYVTMYLSIMIEPNDDRTISGGNDDGTISRFRRVFVPRRGL